MFLCYSIRGIHMMENKNLETLLRNVRNGNVIDTVHCIETYRQIDSSSALKILITLCKYVCQSESKCEVSPENVLHLTILCCTNITSTNVERETEDYLTSLYHLIKYMLNQGLLTHIIKLYDFIIPQWINKQCPSKSYEYFKALFHNEIVKSKNTNENILKHLLHFAFRLQLLNYEENFVACFDKIFNYCAFFRHQKVGKSVRTEFCQGLLNLLDTINLQSNEEAMGTVYKILLCAASIILENLKTFDDGDLENIKICLQQVYQLMRKLCVASEYVATIQSLERITEALIKDLKHRSHEDLFALINCKKTLSCLIKQYGYTVPVIRTCNHIAQTIRILVDHFEIYKDLWPETLQTDIQIELIQIIDIVGRAASKDTNSACKCSSECTAKCGLFQAVEVNSLPGVLVRTSLKMNMSCEEKLHNKSIRCLERCCTFIEEMKQAKCQKWITYWRIIATSVYNIALILYKEKNYAFEKPYIHLLCKQIIAIEGTKNSSICFEDCLSTSLYLYTQCCTHLKQSREAAAYAALTVVFCPSFRTKALHLFTSLKATDNSITFHRVLEQDQNVILELYPFYKYDKKVVEEALMYEVHYYAEYWPSKALMNSVCDEICSITNNVVNRTKAFISTWQKAIILLDSTYITNLEKSIEMLAKRNSITDKICLSALYYVLYQFKSQEVIKKNLDDMNEAILPLKNIPLKPYEEAPNPNDKCDIVPAYYNIRLENKLPLYKTLTKCVDLWSVIFNSNILNKELNLLVDLNIGELIKQTAFEYRLQHFHVHMLRTWFIYLKYGEICDDYVAVFVSIGFILESSDCKSSEIHNLEMESSAILMNSNIIDSAEIIATYYINKCTGYWQSGLIEQGYEALCQSEEYANNINDSTKKVVQARILYLKASYLLMPCNEKLLEHDSNALLVVQNAFTLIAESYKEGGSNCPYVLSILFDINLSNGWIYKWLRLPREVRSYTKESVILAQKLALPIRTTQFLSLLAFTDLLDQQYADCGVKLTGMSKILSYGSGVISEKSQDILINENLEEINKKFEKCTLEHDVTDIEIMLDVPAPKYVTSTMQSSPDLQRNSFTLPAFMSHVKNCECFNCLNFEYHTLILQAVHLEAQLNLYQDNGSQAYEFFKGGLLLYEKWKNKSKSYFQLQQKNFNNNNISKHFFKNTSNAYCMFLLDFSDYLAQQRNVSKAHEIIKNALKILSAEKYRNVFFCQELMAKKLNFIAPKLFEMNQESNSLQVRSELKVEGETENIKTPELKISKTSIHVSISPADARPTKSIKSIKFDLSDSEEEADIKLVKTPELKPAYFKIQTPAITPASKIKIFTPSTIKSVKRNKVVPSIPTTPSMFLCETNADAKAKCLSEIKPKCKKLLEKRTRLLTEKLKSEKKAVVTEQTVDLFYTEKESTVLPRRTVRKNLLDELSDDTTKKAQAMTDKKKSVSQSCKAKTGSHNCADENIKKCTRFKGIINFPASSSDDSGNLGTTMITEKTKSENKLVLKEYNDTHVVNQQASGKESDTTMPDIKKSVCSSSNNSVDKTVKKTGRYKRIVKPPSNESSSDDSGNLGIRRSARNKKQ